jgi:hypothetical protein
MSSKSIDEIIVLCSKLAVTEQHILARELAGSYNIRTHNDALSLARSPELSSRIAAAFKGLSGNANFLRFSISPHLRVTLSPQ